MTAAAPNYDRTVVACFNGYVTQAIINNFMPLLFVTFSATGSTSRYSSPPARRLAWAPTWWPR